MIQARRRFGQNFLIEKSTIARIIESLKISPQDSVIEIGPGKGALTERLVESQCNLTLIEIDRDLVDTLKRKYQGLSIVNEDVLKIDFSSFFGIKPKRIIGNLPYNISTPLLFKLSRVNEWIIDMHVMLQKEVAERIVSESSRKEYGRLSVSIQLLWEVTKLFDVSPTAFSPQPKVNSSFICLKPKKKINFDRDLMNQLLTSAFSARRKTLKNALRNYLNESELRSIDIDPGSRPENLIPEDFIRCVNFLKKKL
mgnify:FL=1